jgi:hypothetical protein
MPHPLFQSNLYILHHAFIHAHIMRQDPLLYMISINLSCEIDARYLSVCMF